MNVLMSYLLAMAALPMGSAPEPIDLPHFPDRVHAFVFRNWTLVPVERMAEVIDAEPEDVRRIGEAMGLGPAPEISDRQWARTYITIVRRNWHLLPYDQLLQLLDWTEEEMAYALREDDFLYVKLGNLKPKCPPLKYQAPSEAAMAREKEIAAIVASVLEQTKTQSSEPLLAFLDDLTGPFQDDVNAPRTEGLRMCYSYFALYGDSLADPKLDPFPEGLLQRLSASGVNAVWLQGVLFKLAPYPWEPALSAGYEARLENLRKLTERAEKHGVKIYVYLNEPRSMPLSFFDAHPGLKGVAEGEWAAVCTSVPEVQAYLRDAVAHVAKAVPKLGGFFTITASENLTNCWSHGNGAGCPQCKDRAPAAVVAEVNALIQQGIEAAGSDANLIAWDWGWGDWAPDAIGALPKDVWLQSVSEWSLPLNRGGVSTAVGEYSISAVGPGPRATQHWAVAQDNGLTVSAKIQAGNTWELSAVPYIPAVDLVAQHVANLRDRGVENIMLGWTLGGYPSPNLEVAATLGAGDLSVDEALDQVAQRRYGQYASEVRKAWSTVSEAFPEFPYHGGVVYNAPLQMGPANLLYGEPTGYNATMVGIPYDDLDRWRAVYPADVFIEQMQKVADGFDEGAAILEKTAKQDDTSEHAANVRRAAGVTRAAALHFASVADQARFVQLRNAETADPNASNEILDREIERATALYKIQQADSRIGYEATNHYFYVPVDLLEKVVNCRYLLKTSG